MATYSSNFAEAMEIIFDWEGRVIHFDPDDPGGLTAVGISKRYNPNWRGWSMFDPNKIGDKSYQQSLLKTGSPFMEEVYDFYYTEMWKRYNLDKYDFMLAFEMFDQVINPGVKAMVTNLQRVLNGMNYQHVFGPDLTVDGAWGPKTRDRIDAVVSSGKMQSLVLGLNCQQGYYYLTRTEANPTQRKYYNGWLKRTEVQKKK